MDKNMISIIIATKNGGRFLTRSVASIERQTEKNIEVIIVSDGSTDDTVSIAQEMAKNRPFLKVIKLEKNIGPGLARNTGIKQAVGEYIAILDDDDEWLDETKLSNQRDFLDRNPEHALVGAAETEFVDESGKRLFVHKTKTNDADIRSKILISNPFIASSVMFRKNTFEKVGGFASMYLAEDYDLWLRLARVGKVANIQNCKIRYYSRQNGAQQSRKSELNQTVLKLVKHYKNNFPHPFLALLTAYARIILG
jgi:glycosyltransferase involved in cell wall biosynthesis